MCCSHVENAGDIGAVVITNCQGSSQGTKRIVAVTGALADEVQCYISHKHTSFAATFQVNLGQPAAHLITRADLCSAYRIFYGFF